MSSGLIAFIFGLAIGGWSYFKIGQLNGNASPSTNAVVAGVIGLVAALVMFTLAKFVLHS